MLHDKLFSYLLLPAMERLSSVYRELVRMCSKHGYTEPMWALMDTLRLRLCEVSLDKAVQETLSLCEAVKYTLSLCEAM